MNKRVRLYTPWALNDVGVVVVVVVKTGETKIVEFYSWSICPSGAMTLGRATLNALLR